MSQKQWVEPYTGEWRPVPVPEEVAAYIGENVLGECPRSVLAVHYAARRHFKENPDASELTLLAGGVSLSNIEEGPLKGVRYRRIMRSLGRRAMRNGGSLDPEQYVTGDFITPGQAFDAATVQYQSVFCQQKFPQGLGFARLNRANLDECFDVGWCDPTNGRLETVAVSVAAVRSNYPKLEPPFAYNGLGDGML